MKDSSYRLRLEEIIFLSASLTQVKTIYGLRGKQLPTDKLEERWGKIKKDLYEKRLIHEQDGKPALCSDVLGRMIYNLSYPRSLVVIKPYEEPDAQAGIQESLTRLYIRGMFTVAVNNDRHEEDCYMLRAYEQNNEVQEILQSTLGFNDGVYTFKKEQMTMNIQTLERLTQVIKDGDQEVACNLAHNHGLSLEGAQDFYGALSQKKNLVSYVIYAFDPAYNEEGRRTTQEVLLYGGAFHLWRVAITEGSVSVAVSQKSSVLQDFQVVSRLMDFI